MLRVCSAGHLIGKKNCWCGALAQRPLQDRETPIPSRILRPLRKIRTANQSAGIEVAKPGSDNLRRRYHRLHWIYSLLKKADFRLKTKKEKHERT